MPVKYKALVLSCIDPRFQPIVFEYLKKRKLDGRYSCFTIAGAAIGVTDKKFKKCLRNANKFFLSTSILDNFYLSKILSHFSKGFTFFQPISCCRRCGNVSFRPKKMSQFFHP